MKIAVKIAQILLEEHTKNFEVFLIIFLVGCLLFGHFWQTEETVHCFLEVQVEYDDH